MGFTECSCLLQSLLSLLPECILRTLRLKREGFINHIPVIWIFRIHVTQGYILELTCEQKVMRSNPNHITHYIIKK